MPCDYSRYPADWKEISARVRTAAGNRCQTCGVANGAVIFRAVDGRSWYCPKADAYFEYPSGDALPDFFETELRDKMTKVVLTVAHTSENGADKHDKHDLRGLKCLCQSCHLAEDLRDHMANARRTRRRRGGQQDLFETEEAQNALQEEAGR